MTTIRRPRHANRCFHDGAAKRRGIAAARFGSTIFAILLAPLALSPTAFTQSVAAEVEPPSGDVAELAARFDNSVRPFLDDYCFGCHDPVAAQGDLDLTRYDDLDSVTADHRHWQIVLQQVEIGNMPPADSVPPTDEARRDFVRWIRDVQSYEATRNAGAPGSVLAHRLSNAEYDYTIRDLTGVDIRPTRDFPVDPANEAGFDNTGESLAMSPALLGKYLDAARQVASHMVLLPRGITFAPFPVTAETDLDKFCVNRIIDFYQSQPTDLADYFHAAWKYRHRDSLGMPDATLDDIARSSSISGKYLGIVWAALTDDASADESVGPIAALRILWNELPGPVENAADANSDDSDADVKARCEAIRDFVVGVRERLAPKVANLTAPSVGDGAQPLVIWKNDQMAANRRRYVGGALVPELAPLPPGSPAAAAMVAPDGLDEAASFEATFHRFCDVFPDTFVVTERARVFLDPESEKSLTGRWLSAGFHNQMGYYRDDRPLCDLILDDASRARLDSLWEEFYFAASIPFRQYSSFIWFERAESGFIVDDQFNFARAEDKDCTSPEKVSRLREVYLEKARKVGASEVAMAAMDDYFDSMTAMFRHYERLAVESQSHHLEAVLRLAERAYRRPLTDDENADLIDFYRFLREDDGLDHAAAIGDLVVSILASPNFCYRIDFTEPVGIAADGNGTPTASADSARSSIAPLTDTALANRLSYFLWSTMPDDELMGLAKAGRLRQPDVMRAQARRMLADPKVAALATEFGGNWLDFRRFEEHNAVDRDRFPTFDNELRRAMFEEPIRFMIDLFSNDGPVTDFLEGRHTFVNPVLAKHYGLDLPSRSDEWVRVDDATVVGRGGILPMAVFLTKNAPGLRTSPVKRGYWVAKRVLGDPIPAPPADVPDLPNDEAALGELTLREALAAHREHKSCATCHQRFDSLGLVFEGYGPIGERRGIDLGGREVETSAVFPDGSEGDGLGGLLRYIADQRREDFLASFCRNLLAYSLGRSLLLSDEPTVDRMLTSLAENDYRFASAIDIIVTSPQFLQKQFP